MLHNENKKQDDEAVLPQNPTINDIEATDYKNHQRESEECV